MIELKVSQIPYCSGFTKLIVNGTKIRLTITCPPFIMMEAVMFFFALTDLSWPFEKNIFISPVFGGCRDLSSQTGR
jgi:hypothetical protein